MLPYSIYTHLRYHEACIEIVYIRFLKGRGEGICIVERIYETSHKFERACHFPQVSLQEGNIHYIGKDRPRLQPLGDVKECALSCPVKRGGFDSIDCFKLLNVNPVSEDSRAF